MYVRQTPKGTWRFAECYKDPLTGKRREVSVTLAKNTAAARKEAAICLQKKIAAMSAPDSRSIRLGDLIDKFTTYQLKCANVKSPFKCTLLAHILYL